MASQHEQVATEPPQRGEAGETSRLHEALVAAGTGGRHPGVAAQLNALLRAVRGGPGAQADAQTILDGLESGAFEGLVDDQGAGTRREAVEALLRLGYPWALQVHPRDLDFLRQSQRKRPWVRALIALAAALAVAAAGAAVVLRPAQVDFPQSRQALAEHLALVDPASAPTELVVGNTVTTPTVSWETGPDGDSVVEVALRARAAAHARAPRLQVRSLGVYTKALNDEEPDPLRASFPGEAATTSAGPAGERMATLKLPVPRDLAWARDHFYVVLDVSVNGMPARALRTDLVDLTAQPPEAPRLALDAQPSLLTPLPAELAPPQPARFIVSVDADGLVDQVVPLGPEFPERPRLVKALELARFSPARVGQTRVGTTFVFSAPAAGPGGTPP